MIYTDKTIKRETERQDVKCLYEELLKTQQQNRRKKLI